MSERRLASESHGYYLVPLPSVRHSSSASDVRGAVRSLSMERMA